MQSSLDESAGPAHIFWHPTKVGWARGSLMSGQTATHGAWAQAVCGMDFTLVLTREGNVLSFGDNK